MKQPSFSGAVEKARNADTATSDFDDTQEDAGQRLVVFTRVSPEMKKALRILAAEEGTKEQHLMVEAINLLFIKYDRKPL